MAELTARDIGRSERLRTVTDNRFFWEGKRFVGLGPVLLLGALIVSAPGLNEWIATGILIVAFAAALVVADRMGRAYRAELGGSTPIPGAHARRAQLKWFFVYPLMLISLAVDMLLAPPFFVSGLVWAGAILAYRRSTGGGRGHYLVLAAAIAGLGLAPLAGIATARDMVTVMMLVLGAGYSAAVWLDDREMRDILKAR